MTINLKEFLTKKMKMTGPYQAMVIYHCLLGNGTAKLSEIAKDLSSRDSESIDYYISRLKVYPKEVLRKHGVAEIEQDSFRLNVQLEELELATLKNICLEKIEKWYIENEKKEIADPSGWGAIRFRMLKKYKRCVLCGAKPHPDLDIELDVDHILPSSKGGSDDESNLQVLCSQCNRAKGNRDNEDFRPKETSNCVFCSGLEERTLNIKSKYFWIIRDNFPVTKFHTLIIPKIHLASPTEMDSKHWEELGRVSSLVKNQILLEDSGVTGFNMGFNDGESAGQTIFHVHFHIIPRRIGDHPAPRGGIRGVIPDKQSY